ncbi:MAG: hypothetical protein OXF41_03190 [bacterium]|nr:hypothetical protein [bacterium]
MEVVDTRVLECLYSARLASPSQLGVLLAEFGKGELARARHRLYKAGLADYRRRQSGGTVWVLTAKAHRSVAATLGLPPRRFIGIDALNNAHTLGTT